MLRQSWGDWMEWLIETLEKNGIQVIVSQNSEKIASKFEGAKISYALSVAEDTGIIFMGGEKDREESALAEHHVVIVKKDVIMPDTISAFLEAKKKERIIFASNSPSKTADIEGELIFGMHGPAKLTAILEG